MLRGMEGNMEQIQHHNKRWNWLVYFGVAIWTLFIWRNSLMPASESAAQSLQVLDVLDFLLEWLGLPVSIGHWLVRKLAHMLEFALLGVLWELALVTKARGHKGWYSVQCACGLCLLTAMMDETIQVFVPGRGSQVTDVWIDFAGACFGVLVVFVLTGYFGKKRRTESR